jgi:hypothetical protein
MARPASDYPNDGTVCLVEEDFETQIGDELRHGHQVEKLFDRQAPNISAGDLIGSLNQLDLAQGPRALLGGLRKQKPSLHDNKPLIQLGATLEFHGGLLFRPAGQGGNRTFLNGSTGVDHRAAAIVLFGRR